jgi:hypothetical protein
VVYIVQGIKDCFAREDLTSLTEKAFIYHFLEKYMTPNQVMQSPSLPKNRKMLRRIDSNLSLRADLSMLPKILNQVTL